ncbi:MAG: aldose 1-epimerase family protein [Lachnospiraceae bacterium]|nr:aldose 1-epimerase family protein [Lachnospiraceae bacterium]
MRYVIENDILRCETDTHGAEIKSLIKKDGNREIMWSGDPAYWNRTAPVLFPFVGAVKEKTYRHKGIAYNIGQHGFARDMEFELVSKEDTEVWFSLSENGETLSKYPFRFRLQIGYRVEEASVKVMWSVTNTNDEEMYFSIGAHPGFAVDSLSGKSFALFDMNGNPVSSVKSRIFGQGGCATDNETVIGTPGGKLAITESLFDNDALIIENGQIGTVKLLEADGTGLVSVSFDAPLVGLWSPPHKNAPFVCIEPWYGRCDRENFDGELKDRDYEQSLEAGKRFEAEYTITVG